MSILKRVARVAVGAILATGIFASASAPADAAAQPNGQKDASYTLLDTGWGP